MPPKLKVAKSAMSLSTRASAFDSPDLGAEIDFVDGLIREGEAAE